MKKMLVLFVCFKRDFKLLLITSEFRFIQFNFPTFNISVYNLHN